MKDDRKCGRGEDEVSKKKEQMRGLDRVCIGDD